MNTCTYSRGGKHDYCPHPHYCIFNKNREDLERKIAETQNEYKELKESRNSYLKGYYHNITDYDFHLKQMKVTRDKLIRLIEFRNKILKEKVENYGYLES